MNNNQPSSTQTTILDSKLQGRSRVRVAVFSVLAVHVAGLTALLLTQGCKREVPHETEIQPELPPMLDTNQTYYTETNPPPNLPPSTNAYVPPVPPVSPVSPVPPVSTGTTEYVVKSGDSFYTIAKSHGTTIKAIEAANPGVDSRRLKIGQKLVLPDAGAIGLTSAPAPAPTTSAGSTYVVKSGDTLSRIASSNNTTVKELKALNGLTTDRINVGQKLKLPPPPAPAPVPMVEPLPVAPLTPAPAPIR
jgi:LysM repeat protein